MLVFRSTLNKANDAESGVLPAIRHMKGERIAMSFYRREVRVGHSLLLRESNASWIKIDVLCLDGMRVQVGVDAPVDYPSGRVERDLVIGPVRVFVLNRVGTQKVLMGIRAPRRFSVVRRDDRGASGVKQPKTRAKKTGGTKYVPVAQQQNRGGKNTLVGAGGACGGEKPLLRSDLDQRHALGKEAAPLMPGLATEREMLRLLSRNRHRLH